MTNILGIIPARGGSKGLKNKNIKFFLGKPLIYWTILEAKKSKFISKLIVSTDSKKILNLAIKYKAEVPFLRPKNISSDSSSSYELIRHALNFYKKKIQFDYIILLEPTSPLRSSDDIDDCIRIVLKKKIKSLISVAAVKSQHPKNLFTLNNKKKLLIKKRKNIARRQKLKNFYYPEGSIYISDVNTILKFKSFYNSQTYCQIFPEWKSFEVDDINDFILIEKIYKLKKYFEKKIRT